MKEMLKNIAGLILIFILIIVLPGLAGYIETHYKEDVKVISTEENIVIVEKNNGESYAFYGTDYHKDDVIKVMFFTNYTDNTCKDDEIVKVCK